jgi:hypothetical protein
MNAQSTCGATIGAVAVAVPSAEARYLRAVVGRSADVLGDGLVGVYPTGSVALGAYTPGRIDLDVMAVVAQPPPEPVLREVAARLAHEALPCPATGLEFVVYPRDVVATAGGHAGFLLDLNTGRQLNAKVSTDPRVNRGSGTSSTVRSPRKARCRWSACRYVTCSPRHRSRRCARWSSSR